METTRRLALRVGALVVAGVVTSFVIILMLGRERMWFKEKVTYHAGFPDVAGLQVGAIVRLGGRDVGLVTDIDYGDPLDPPRALVVTFRMRAEYAERVRADTKATIATQGLLGDKLLSLNIGSPTAEPVPPGGWIPGEPPADTSQLIAEATATAKHAHNIMARLDEYSAGLEEQGALEDASAALAGVRRIVERVEHGPGTAHSVIFDDALSRTALATLRSGEAAARNLAAAGARASRILGVIRLDTPTEDLLVDSALAAKRLAALAGSVDPAALRRASEDLAAVVAEVRAGRGTLGGLIMDPTLYEETKRVLVNIRRNRVLRALSRYLISRSSEEAVMDAAPDAVKIRPRKAPAPPPEPTRAGRKGRRVQ